MRVHHAFGIAFRAGGKQHHCRVFWLLRNLRPAWQQQVREDPQFVLQRDGILQILQIDPLHLRQPLRQVPQVAFLRELARGKHGFHLRGGQRARMPLMPAVVEHGRHAPAQ